MTTTNDQLARQLSDQGRQLADQGKLIAVLQERVGANMRRADQIDGKVDGLDNKLDALTATITGFVNRVEGGRIVIRWGWRIGAAVLAALGAAAYFLASNWAKLVTFFVR